MERIVRGLANTTYATQNRDTQALIEGYGDGLNANMCRALLNMVPSGSYDPIEYTITWSPKFKPSDDIQDPTPFLITEPSYDQLEYAAVVLEKLEPKEITIRGFIKELKVDDNPLGTDTARTVIVQVTNASSNVPAKIAISLNKADYQDALRANGDWLPVDITGILQKRRGDKWYIVKYSSFNVTPRLL